MELKELHKIFPEAQDIIDQKIFEDVCKIKELQEYILEVKKAYDLCVYDEKSFWLMYIEKRLTELRWQKEVEELEKELACLRRHSLKKEIRFREISERDIDEARRYPIVNLLELKSSGQNLECCCPFHKEKTASFVVYPGNNWYCYGCKQGGDVIHLYQKLKGCTFREAIEDLT